MYLKRDFPHTQSASTRSLTQEQQKTNLQHSYRLLNRYPELLVIITLGSKGAICGSSDLRFSVAAPVIDAVDTTCAGDTFIGYFMAAYLNKQPLPDCLQQGCRAGAIAACRPGASSSIPFKHEVMQNNPIVS